MMKRFLSKLLAFVMTVSMLSGTVQPVMAEGTGDASEALSSTSGAGKPSTGDNGMALGSDISWAADTDREYLDSTGTSRKLYDICRNDYGMNTVRLRTWLDHKNKNGESDGQCSKENIIAYAKKCQEENLRVMLDFHYADDWADPGKQPPPAAWNVTDNISKAEAERVGKLLYDYTYDYLTDMKAAGVTPEWVQVGNEITNGMLWPLCNIANMENLAYVLNQGIAAVRAASPETKIVLHIDNGASTDAVTKWYEDIVAAGVTDFDVLGLSFYPRDHDPTAIIESLTNTFDSLYNEFCKDTDREIMVVEIGANYLENCTNNQSYNMIVNVINALKAIPDNRGTGCIYWEIENYEMEKDDELGGKVPNKVWEAFSPNAAEVNENPVTGIELAETEISVEENDIHQMNLTVTPKDPDVTRMVWTSSNPEVFTVSSSGMVRGIKPGEATLTVTNYAGKDDSYQTFTKTCKVTITEEKPGLKNGGFELGDNGVWKYKEGNKGEGTLGVSANALNSTSSLHFTGKTEDLDFSFYQDIEGLQPGKYSLKAYVMGDSGVSSINLFAKTDSKEFTSKVYKTIGWGGSANFVEMTLNDIIVKEGEKLQVGSRTAAVYTGSEAWGDYDNFSLKRVGELPSDGMALGSDISWAADTDKEYFDSEGTSRKLYDICRNDYGMNTVRLRTWLDHKSGQCSKENIIAYAKKCQEEGLRVMLDFHYADDWADPGKQPPPAAWEVTDDISEEEAKRVGKLLYDYTYDYLTDMINAGVTPEWVQVGNEITNGMLWPLCNIANMENFAYVLNQGIAAVRAASPETKIVLHIDNGASTDAVTKWYEDIIAAGVTDFDVLGLSFYPRDHDPTAIIESLTNTFDSLYNKFCKDTDREIMVVEIGANYLEGCTNNQSYNMIVNVINALKAIPDNRGTGCIYWEIENYEMDKNEELGGKVPNKVWEAFSPNAAEVNENPVTGIELAETEISVEENDIHQMNLTVTPKDPDVTRMVWTSSNPEVFTVSSSGMVRGIKPGEATLTVTNYAGKDDSYQTFTKTCKVTITEEKPGLKNGGFELGDNGIWKYDENNKGTGTLGVSANALNSTSSLHFTGGAEDLDFTFYQDIEGLRPGKYRLKGFVMGDSGVTSINLFAKATDKEFTSETYKTIGWGGSANFVEMTLDNIEVRDGKLRVGAHAAAVYEGSEAWGDFDNFSLEWVGDLPSGDNTGTGGNTGNNTPVNYTVTFNSNGGSSVSGVTVASGNKVTAPKNPTRKNYTFDGWYIGNTKYNFNTAVTGNLTLTAKWKKVTVSTPKISSVKNKKSKQVTVTMKKVSGAAGYQVTYSTNKKFKKGKSTKTVSSKKNTITIKKLKKGVTYYVKVKAYKKDSTNKNVYSKFSKVKKIKIKK